MPSPAFPCSRIHAHRPFLIARYRGYSLLCFRTALSQARPERVIRSVQRRSKPSPSHLRGLRGPSHRSTNRVGPPPEKKPCHISLTRRRLAAVALTLVVWVTGRPRATAAAKVPPDDPSAVLTQTRTVIVTDRRLDPAGPHRRGRLPDRCRRHPGDPARRPPQPPALDGPRLTGGERHAHVHRLRRTLAVTGVTALTGIGLAVSTAAAEAAPSPHHPRSRLERRGRAGRRHRLHLAHHSAHEARMYAMASPRRPRTRSTPSTAGRPSTPALPATSRGPVDAAVAGSRTATSRSRAAVAGP